MGKYRISQSDLPDCGGENQYDDGGECSEDVGGCEGSGVGEECLGGDGDHKN